MKRYSASRGKRPVVFAVLLVVLVIVAGIAVLLPSIAKNQYWKASHLQNAVLDLAEYDGRIAEHDASLGEVEATVHRCNASAVPVRPALAPFFDVCDQMIVRYFRDVYEVDLTERMDALQVMEAAYPEEVSQMVGGSHSSDFPGKLFLNADVLEELLSDMEGGELPEAAGTAFSVKMLRTVYIHEVMHYLGFNSGRGFDHFMEAFAESLNQEVMLHSGVKYESITGYAAIQGFAAQIAECDPAFVREGLAGNGSDLAAYFNSRLGGAPHVNYAEYYDKLIGLLQKGGHEDQGKLKYYTQYLTYEYCKAANEHAKDILSGGGLFEVKWLLGVG